MLIDKVRVTIAKREMLRRGDNVLLCLSGGIDSMVMLDIFTALSTQSKLALSICHLNHNLRGAESERDLRFVEETAREKGIAFYSKTLQPDELKTGASSTQGLARSARYAFFNATGQGCNASRIALAHNMDDQAETVLMRVINGTGLKGLSGIPALRGRYIRPLIDISRREIEKYATLNNIKYVFDSSNKGTKYLRNRIRHSLLPMIESEYNPRAKRALASIASRAESDYAFIEDNAKKLYNSALIAGNSGAQGQLVFSLEMLRAAPKALSIRAFLTAIESIKGDSKGIFAVHIESFLDLLATSRPGASINLPGSIVLKREYERVIVEVSEPRISGAITGADADVALDLCGVTPFGPGGGQFVATEQRDSANYKNAPATVAFFDLDQIGHPVIIRHFKPGDRLKPMGMEGTRKVKDIFIDRKTPRSLRRAVPLLFCGADLLWVVGIRQSRYAMVTPSTKRVLRLEWKGGPLR